MNKLAVLALAAVAGTASAATVDVSYSITAGPGNWVLDFTVANNIPAASQSIYFFGVELDSGRNIAGSPSPFDPNVWTAWDNTGYGGSSTVYNNNWIEPTYTALLSGSSLSGFQAISTGATAPASVDWFCYAYSLQGEGYFGNDAFYQGGNPGFEGTAVPAPAALAAFGIAGLAATRRRR